MAIATSPEGGNPSDVKIALQRSNQRQGEGDLHLQGADAETLGLERILGRTGACGRRFGGGLVRGVGQVERDGLGAVVPSASIQANSMVTSSRTT